MRRIAMIAVLLGLLAACTHQARAAEISSLISGRDYPLSVRLGDLDSQWRRFTPGGQAGGDTLLTYFALLGGSSGTLYTKGWTAEVGGDTYLIAYGRRVYPVDFIRMMQSGPHSITPEALTPDTELSLSLLNLRIMGNMCDIRAFDLEQELAEYEGAEEEELRTESLSNLKNLALAVQMWLADHNDVIPDLTDSVTVLETLEEYVRNDEVFFHPETGKPYVPNAYLSGKNLAEIEDPRWVAVFYEESWADDGTRGVAFLDGHAARVRPDEWDRIRAASNITQPAVIRE
jgi:hypothetical protein